MLYHRDELLINRDEQDEARLYMDQAIDRLEESFGHLRSALMRERNSTVSAVRLPPEVLVDVLSYGGVRTTFLATRVCHTWRIAALSHAPLWSRIHMASRKFSKDLLQLQLEKSGSYPLDVTFDLVEESDSVINKRLPPMPTSIIERASSIANLATTTLPPNWSHPLPLLESLDLVVSQSTPVEEYAFKPSNLRHLSVKVRGTDIPLPPSVVRNLRTFHLHLSREPAIRILQIVINIKNLQELFLDGCQNRAEAPIEQVDEMVQNTKSTPLKLVHLKKLSDQFLLCFLRPEIVSPSTSLRIEPRPPMQFQRHIPTTSCWIDLKNKHTLYEHKPKTTLTYMGLEDSSIAQPLLNMGMFINFSMVTSLCWKGGTPQDPPFQFFPALASLTFELYPAIVGERRQGLGDIVGEYLLSSCPRLEYLGISIRRPKSTSSVVQVDGAEHDLPAFLEEWVDTYGEVFSKVELFDEYLPRRWSDALDTLLTLTWSFELKEKCVMDSVQFPRFPETRQFVVKDLDEEPLPFRGFAQTFW